VHKRVTVIASKGLLYHTTKVSNDEIG